MILDDLTKADIARTLAVYAEVKRDMNVASDKEISLTEVALREGQTRRLIAALDRLARALGG